MSRDRESIDEVIRKSINEGLNVNPLMPRNVLPKTPPKAPPAPPARGPAKEGD